MDRTVVMVTVVMVAVVVVAVVVITVVMIVLCGTATITSVGTVVSGGTAGILASVGKRQQHDQQSRYWE